MTAPHPFVTADWLADHLTDPKVIAVEGTYFLPDEGRDADAEFHEGHIPGAVRFDIDAISDHESPLPHMLPDAETFAQAVGALGISEDMTIVVYDRSDLIGGARAWWMFTHYGAKHVRLLDGGFKAWNAAGLPVETGAPARPAKSFAASFDAADVASADTVHAAAQARSAQIVDARSAARFEGSVPEPRAGLRSGHVPHARNVPWRAIVGADGKIKSKQELAQIFKAAGVDTADPIITTCGSGVSAAILVLALEILGRTGIGLYDGSWSEWGGRADLPVETGAAEPLTATSRA